MPGGEEIEREERSRDSASAYPHHLNFWQIPINLERQSSGEKSWI